MEYKKRVVRDVDINKSSDNMRKVGSVRCRKIKGASSHRWPLFVLLPDVLSYFLWLGGCHCLSANSCAIDRFQFFLSKDCLVLF